MNFKIDVDTLIYSYLFICILLIIYNVMYIIHSRKNRVRGIREKSRWIQRIFVELTNLEQGKNVTSEHMKLLVRKLGSAHKLMSYYQAMNQCTSQWPRTLINEYLEQCAYSFQLLAEHYGKRDSMEKAAFSYFISEYVPYQDHQFHPIIAIMLEYFEDSSIYCRENLVRALSAFGNIQAVLNIVGRFEEDNLYHHKKLLTDGLADFTGDKEELALELWKVHREYSENMNLAIIGYITSASDDYGSVFLQELMEYDNTPEERLAMIRYFKNHHYEPARDFLIDVLKNDKNETADIVAAFVLSSYPCDETRAALKESLGHPNWYVRQNAAYSYVDMTQDQEELNTVLNGEDQFARDMVNYVLAQRGRVVENV